MRLRRVMVAVLFTLAGTMLLVVPVEWLPDLEAALIGGASVELVAHVALSAAAVVLWGALLFPALPPAATMVIQCVPG